MKQDLTASQLPDERVRAGSKLWYVPNGRHQEAREVTVIRVGSKWAYLDSWPERIDIESLTADGGKYTPPGQCWLSQQHYADAQLLASKWQGYRALVSAAYRAPVGLTLEKIDEMIKELQ